MRDATSPTGGDCRSALLDRLPVFRNELGSRERKNQKVHMSLPTTNHDPGFRITRAGHLVLDVRDFAASRRFYEEVIGLILTAEEGDALYFRGVEEACHHSLVLRKGGAAACARLGRDR
ncbi:VOC family protein [Bradyrhizobium sp. CCBAU 53421]|uniref:VOC family protein n=1 Tax=Bradyrhizobium sp. CCBAU 53421 TaxID=1325120 RepID=UPI001FED4239|nr:VOC family protein [Bradyrhizobium sp. CCBAU 53421]